ncbi:MAG: ATP-binding protein [Winogradskyella sp.]|uniref:AAA family ATPase n=1 Tax=Winogradskyella sp. TaxID=1883156 RepID=UPI0017E0A1B5|nr:ATP-binding protein [Winogradskyella sp.]
MKLKRIVITGGPATGKTAIIDDLNVRGYTCYEEVIRKLTADAQNKGEITEPRSNPIALVNDPELFNTTLINLRIKDFEAAAATNKSLAFYDRGVPDVLAYMAYFNQSISKDFEAICNNHSYDHVFILPPWKAIFKDDAERFETFEQATAIYHHLEHTYQNFGYKPIEVPFGSIKERTNFIIEQLNL